MCVGACLLVAAIDISECTRLVRIDAQGLSVTRALQHLVLILYFCMFAYKHINYTCMLYSMYVAYFHIPLGSACIRLFSYLSDSHFVSAKEFVWLASVSQYNELIVKYSFAVIIVCSYVTFTKEMLISLRFSSELKLK